MAFGRSRPYLSYQQMLHAPPGIYNERGKRGRGVAYVGTEPNGRRDPKSGNQLSSNYVVFLNKSSKPAPPPPAPPAPAAPAPAPAPPPAPAATKLPEAMKIKKEVPPAVVPEPPEEPITNFLSSTMKINQAEKPPKETGVDAFKRRKTKPSTNPLKILTANALNI